MPSRSSILSLHDALPIYCQGGEVLARVNQLRVGLAVSLTGPLAAMGTATCRGLALWAEEARVALVVRDDGSERAQVRHAVEMRSEEHTSELQSLRHLVCRRGHPFFPCTTLFRSTVKEEKYWHE